MLDRFIGLTLTELQEIHNMNPFGGFSIFRLQSEDDDTGMHIVDDPTVSGALDRVPSLADAYIHHAEDYYGTFVLRVSSRRPTC